MSMMKYRVHEVAKDFNSTSKVISQILTDYATTPKNHMQVLENDELDLIFEYLTQHNQVGSIAEIFNTPAQAESKPSEKKPAKDEKAAKPTMPPAQSAASAPVKKEKENKPHVPRQVAEKRVIDTRGSAAVNMTKYDEKFDKMAGERGRDRDRKGGKEKIVNKSKQRQQQAASAKRRHLEDCSCIIVQATGKRKIKLNLIGKSHLLERIQNKAGFLYAFKSSLRSGKHLCDGLQFIIVGTLEANDRLQLLNGLFANTASSKLVVDIIQPYLVQLVYCNRNINNLVSFAYYLSDTGKNLTVVNLDLNANAESAEDGIDNLHQFYLIEQRIRTNNIGITLEELAIASSTSSLV